jgi:hypothetical protein
MTPFQLFSDAFTASFILYSVLEKRKIHQVFFIEKWNIEKNLRKNGRL